MNQALNQAFGLVSQSNNNLIKQGEAQLAQLKRQINYPVQLLAYMDNSNTFQAKLRAAIQLKLWCQSYYNMEPFQKRQFNSIINELKVKIVSTYLSYPQKIGSTIRPGIVNLANSLYPDNWNQLMPGLVQFATEKTDAILTVLKLIQDITYKYSVEQRSDPLYTEIILVCDQTHDFLLNITGKIITSNVDFDDNTLQILQCLMKIFYHENYQDLHPKYEDNLGNWMHILKQVMNFQNSSQQMFKCKGAALQSVLLYASKYKQDVQDSIKGFSSQIWNLCENATDDMEYDTIVFNCLKFFRSLVMWSDMKPFFNQNLNVLLQKLIYPNLKITKKTLQTFYEQPELFIDYYFRNAQIGTRRAASLDLLRVISRHYQTFNGYLLNQIQNFDPNSSLKQKCNLLNLVIDGSAKGFRDVDGCTSLFVQPAVINHVYQNIVKNDLAVIYNWIIQHQNTNIENQIDMILIISLLRFVYFYRIYLPIENIQLIIKFCSSIQTNCFPLKSVLFMVINAFLTIRHGDFNMYKNLNSYFNSQNSHNIAADVLQTIYKNDKCFPSLNQHLTTMLFNLTKILKQKTMTYYEYFQQLFIEMLKKTQIYDFKSALLLFQAIGNVSFWAAKVGSENKKKLENQIFDYFAIAMKRNSDLLNFCFQILSIFLQFDSKTETRYIQLYNSILDPGNWTDQNMSIMSSYIQFISAYLIREPSNLIDDKSKFEVILSKLVQIQHNDLFYRFLETILKITNLQQFFNIGYFQLCIHGTQAIASKSTIGKKIGVNFIFKLLYLHNTQIVINDMMKISNNFFQNILQSSYDIIQSMQHRRDRKIMYGALCNVVQLGILNPQFQGKILDLLVDNSTVRFSFSKVTQSIKQNEERQKKQATYQKLSIFKQIQQKQSDIEIDQEIRLCQSFRLCQSQNRSCLNWVQQKNHQRVQRLFQKHSKNLNF